VSAEADNLRYKIQLVMEGLRHPEEAEKAMAGSLTPADKAALEAAYNEFLEIVGHVAWFEVHYHPMAPSREIGKLLVAGLKERGFEIIAI